MVRRELNLTIREGVSPFLRPGACPSNEGFEAGGTTAPAAPADDAGSDGVLPVAVAVVVLAVVLVAAAAVAHRRSRSRLDTADLGENSIMASYTRAPRVRVGPREAAATTTTNPTFLIPTEAPPTSTSTSACTSVPASTLASDEARLFSVPMDDGSGVVEVVPEPAFMVITQRTETSMDSEGEGESEGEGGPLGPAPRPAKMHDYLTTVSGGSAVPGQEQ